MSKYVGKIVTNQAPAGYSVYFDGNGDTLSIANNAALNVGAGDFCIETWFYFSSTTVSQIILSNAGAFGSDNTQIDTNSSSNIRFASSATVWLTSSGTPTINSWNHVAVSRSGTTLSMFVNGSRQATATNSTNFANANNYSFAVGAAPGYAAQFTGYVSNIRVVKGSSVYDPTQTSIRVPTQFLRITNTQLLTCNSPAIVDQSSNAFAITVNGNAAVSTFTPFTAYVPYNPALGASTPGVWTLDEAMQAAATRQWNMYDPYFQNTTLLLHGNARTWITDASTNNFAITVNGNARAANLSPFSLTTFATSGSGYFDGSGDFLVVPSAPSSLVFGTGDFTWEAWINADTVAAGTRDFFGIYDGGTTGIIVGQVGANIRFFCETTIITSSTTILANTWYHVAAVKTGTTGTLYINGVSVGTGTVGVPSNTNFSIGRAGNFNGNYFAGYISNNRIVKGTALYTSNFTPSTAPLTAVTNTSLLTLQTSQSENNNTFLDSSSNNFTITRNGNTTQGSFSPFSQVPGAWSNFFNGSSYLTTASNAAFQFGTGDFTMECWINMAAGTSLTSYWRSFLSCAGDSASVNGVTLYIADGASGSSVAGEVAAIIGDNTIRIYGGQDIRGLGWVHVALTRSGTTLRLFVNGVQRTSATNSSNITGTSYGAQIGLGILAQNNYFVGYVSNVRVVKGTALYTADFTPSVAPLTAVVNTSLLTCQSNRFVDNSSNGFTLTPSGTPSVQAFSPFYPTAAYTPATIGGSGYFDGTGDYLSAASNAAFALGSGNFTMEMWVYSGANGTATRLGGNGTGAAWGANMWIISTSTSTSVNKFVFAVNNATPAELLISTSTFNNNQWMHVAIARSGNAWGLWVNGAREAYVASNSAAVDGGTSNVLNLGFSNISGDSAWAGYVSGFKMVKGTAVYDPTSTTITVPTTPPTNTTNTSLLLNFTNAGIVDSTAKNVLETVGNAQISTAQSKFGGSSMYFDGSGDYLQVGPNQLLNIGSSDFTIEFWIYPANFSAVVYPLYSTSARAKTDVLAFEVNTSGVILAYITASGGAAWSIVSAGNVGTLTLNAWNHVALVRNGSNFRGYVNGVQGAMTTTSTSVVASFDGFNIGTNGAGGGFLNGYMDDLRITRFARYTAAFTPQTSQWQDQ